jgi:hypothetical protein
MGNSSPAPVRKLRVTIVGHASPRWRGAPSNADADRLNAILANQRADAVFSAVEKLLRVRLRGNLTIEKNVTLAPGAPQPDSHYLAMARGAVRPCNNTRTEAATSTPTGA